MGLFDEYDKAVDDLFDEWIKDEDQLQQDIAAKGWNNLTDQQKIEYQLAGMAKLRHQRSKLKEKLEACKMYGGRSGK